MSSLVVNSNKDTASPLFIGVYDYNDFLYWEIGVHS